MNKKTIDKTKPHFRVVHFYARQYEPTFGSLQGALAEMEKRRLEGKSSVYSELWQMQNEDDGEMVGFFEDGAPAELVVTKPTTAKLR